MNGVGKFLQGISRVGNWWIDWVWINCYLTCSPRRRIVYLDSMFFSTKQQNRLCDGLGIGELWGGWSSITMLHDEMFLPDCVIAPQALPICGMFSIGLVALAQAS